MLYITNKRMQVCQLMFSYRWRYRLWSWGLSLEDWRDTVLRNVCYHLRDYAHSVTFQKTAIDKECESFHTYYRSCGTPVSVPMTTVDTTIDTTTSAAVSVIKGHSEGFQSVSNSVIWLVLSFHYCSQRAVCFLTWHKTQLSMCTYTHRTQGLHALSRIYNTYIYIYISIIHTHTHTHTHAQWRPS
jgi:hypothetical protein